MRDPFLVLHIVSGTAAMALGALALLAAAGTREAIRS
jgi:hypothetical protein